MVFSNFLCGSISSADLFLFYLLSSTLCYVPAYSVRPVTPEARLRIYMSCRPVCCYPPFALFLPCLLIKRFVIVGNAFRLFNWRDICKHCAHSLFSFQMRSISTINQPSPSLPRSGIPYLLCPSQKQHYSKVFYLLVKYVGEQKWGGGLPNPNTSKRRGIL